MSKTYVRVDDRLIHGQTIMSWAPTLKLEELIAVDDTIAANPMLKSILTMGVPKNYVTHIVSIDEARALLAEDDGMNRMVIVKTPHQLVELRDSIRGCEHVYLGNMAKRDDTVHHVTDATGIFWLSDQDVEDLSALADEGFEISFHQLPNETERSWGAFLKSL